MFYVVNYVPPARLKKINVQARIYASCNKIDRVLYACGVYQNFYPAKTDTPCFTVTYYISYTLYNIYINIYIYNNII